MVKDTVQSLKLENDKLKDKIQEICAELRNLRDEVKAERNVPLFLPKNILIVSQVITTLIYLL